VVIVLPSDSAGADIVLVPSSAYNFWLANAGTLRRDTAAHITASKCFDFIDFPRFP
jgi:hypothetical protein